MNEEQLRRYNAGRHIGDLIHCEEMSDDQKHAALWAATLSFESFKHEGKFLGDDLPVFEICPFIEEGCDYQLAALYACEQERAEYEQKKAEHEAYCREVGARCIDRTYGTDSVENLLRNLQEEIDKSISSGSHPNLSETGRREIYALVMRGAIARASQLSQRKDKA